MNSVFEILFIYHYEFKYNMWLNYARYVKLSLDDISTENWIGILFRVLQ